MNRIIFVIFLVINISAQAKTCVLIFYDETRDSKFTEKINNVFGFDPEVDYFKLAQIQDIENCFRSDEYNEIVWLSHGLSPRQSATSYSAPLLTSENGERFPLLKKFFENLVLNINYKNLKKFRVEVCNIDISTLNILMKDLANHNVVLDVSPRFALGSWLLNENVTNVSYDWLALGMDRTRVVDHWRTDANLSCRFDSWPGCDRQRAKYVVPLVPMMELN